MAYVIPNRASLNATNVPNYSSDAGVSGYHLDFISTTQMFLNPGFARAFGSDFGISYPGNVPSNSPYILLDTTVTGAGGCYPKLVADMALANDTVFGIYVIAKSSGTTNGSLNPAVNVSAVIATGDDFLPPGYDVFRRVALCYVNSATGLLIKWIQAGEGSDKQYLLQDSVAAVTAGTSVTDVTLDLTSGDGVIPPGHANYAQLNISLVAGAAGRSVSVAPTVLTSVGLPPLTFVAPVATETNWATEIVCGVVGSVFANGNAAIKYKVSNVAAAATISVVGFTDSLGNSLF